MTTVTSRRFTSAERAGIRHLAQSPQYGPFLRLHTRLSGIDVYKFTRRDVSWPTVRQAARDSREAPNMWRCVTCHRLQPYFLKRCKGCKGAA